MTIHLDPSRVRLAPGRTGKTEDRRRNAPAPESEALPPKPAKAHVNFIPAPESLRTLIASAVASFKRGITWDRGSILNLLV